MPTTSLCPCREPHDGWPGDGQELCQGCWERACDKAWWAMVAGQAE